MSELIQKQDNRATIRWKLLTGASALALTAYVSCATMAEAEDASRPQLWIELGGELNGLSDGQEAFAPPLMAVRPSIFTPSTKFDGPPRFSLDEYGKISFEPHGSDWVLSASFLYGRSSSNRHVHQQTNPKSAPISRNGVVLPSVPLVEPAAALFADTSAQNSEHHLILDFQAGKDVGLGMFGVADGSSVLNLGVRFAQFSAKSNIALKSDPDWGFYYKYFHGSFLHGFRVPLQSYHSNAASLHATRNFHGVGPSISWNGSAPLAGNPQNSELIFDWGVNAALLFGRQRARTHHQTTGRYHGRKYATAYRPITYQHPATPDHTRSRNVTVPNVGGSVGLSWRAQDFKVSMGYRADMFFGAIDGGIDARKNENRAFYGPFASISVGLGD